MPEQTPATHNAAGCQEMQAGDCWRFRKAMPSVDYPSQGIYLDSAFDWKSKRLL